jgi:PAS domain S-box-containing protein
MPRKPTYDELKNRVKELERQLADLKEEDFASKDFTAYQSVLAVLRGVSLEGTEESFLETFLSEIVKEYGFCMSWYGRHEDGAVRPILSAGKADHYLDNLVLDVKESSSPDAVCAISQAILKGAPFSYADLERDKGFRRWRDYALQLGYRSNLAMPLKVDGQIEGGVMVYAYTPNSFPELRMVRLMQLTNELGALLSERRARLRTERALQESERRFRETVDLLPTVVVEYDTNFRITYTNNQGYEILGYSPKDLAEGVYVPQLFPSEEQKRLQSRLGQLLRGEIPMPTEYKILHKNGSTLYCLVSSSPIFKDGKVVGIRSTATDITSRKLTENALQESEENFRALAENANDCIMIVVREGLHVYANKRATEITGYSLSELRRITIEDLALPEEVEKIKERYRRIIEGQDFAPSYENVLIRKDGRPVPIEVTSAKTTWHGEPADLVIFRDITDRKKAIGALKKAQKDLILQVEERTHQLSELNEKLKQKTAEYKQMERTLDESESRFQTLVEQIPNAIIYTASLDEKSTTLYISPQIEQLLGHTQEEFKADTDLWGKRIHPDDYDGVMAELARCHKTGEQFVSEYRMITKDGRKIWFDDYARIVKDKNGTPLFLLGVMTDITDQKRAREKLKASEEKFSTAFRSSPAAKVISALHDGRLIEVNENFVHMFGYTPEEAIGRTSLELGLWVEPDQRKELVQKLQVEGRVQGFEMSFRMESGENGTALVAAETIVVENEQCLLAAAIDITERRQAYKALQNRESELETKTQELEELNAALKVLLKRREEDKSDLQDSVVVNVKELILPYIEKLKGDYLNPQQATLVSIIESNIKEIVSPFATKLSSKFLNLTPTELQVANLIKDGRSSNEIAELMNLSPNTILFHRYNLRRKLGLKQTKTNLRSYLRSFPD